MPANTAPAADRPVPPFHAAPSQPSNYCPVPQRLITDVHDNPLAIGLYALIGRLYFVVQEPIPLSVPDVLRYDPTLSRGAVIRALKRLVDGGWLLATTRRGHKTRYVPTWGRVKGIAQPWHIGQPCMGRPRHVDRLPLDRALLDVCMGKLTPHPVETAPITRYLTTPALSLADIGCYALTLAGLSHETPALRWLGLVRDRQARPLPSDARLLAIISQRPLTLDESDEVRDTELTTSGTRKLGMVSMPAQNDESSRAQPLFFVPPGMIGSMIRPMIGSMIGSHEEVPAEPIAAASLQTRSDVRLTGITWESKDQKDSGTPPPSPPQPISGVSGGGGSGSAEKRAESGAAAAAPDTEAARALTAFNVRPAIVVELADTPIHVVEAAIADARARPGVRDQAAWAVSMIRDARKHGWHITGYRTAAQQQAVDWEKVIADMKASGMSSDEPDDLEALAEVLDTPPAREPVDLLGIKLRTRLRWLRRDLGPIIERVEVVADGDTPILACRQMEDATALQAVLPQIATALRELGWDAPPQLALIAPPPPPSPPPERRPSWIAAEQWEQLPALLRGALGGSELDGGQLRAASAFQGRLLATRYAPDVNALIESATRAGDALAGDTSGDASVVADPEGLR
jgi:hypothetical protein